MNYPLLHVSIGFIKRHLLQSILLVIGITFGVALIVSVDIANQSASRSFSISKEILSTKSTHHILGAYSDFDEEIYNHLKLELGIENIAPIVEDYVNISNLNDRAVRLLGTDLFADLIFYDTQNSPLPNLSQSTLSELITKPSTALISSDIAQSAGIKIGDVLNLSYGSETLDVEVIGVLDEQDSELSKSLGGLLLTDISTAQELLGKVGLLSQIDLVIDEETADGGRALQSIKNYLPSGVEIKRKDVLLGSAKSLTRSFELNLTALSLLALFVGVFLIYNIVSFSVIQRRSIIGTLSSIGTTHRQIFKMIMAEALGIGIIGSIIGVVGGIFLGRSIVGLVTRSINDLYYTLTVTNFTVSPETIAKGLLAGILATLFAAVVPAFEASRLRPINILRRSTFEGFFLKSIRLFGVIGIIVIALGYIVIILPTKSLILSLLSVFLILFGASLLVPICTTLLMSLFSFLLSPIGLISRMSPRNVIRSSSRTAVAIASLTVAISVILSVSIMIGSFRSTVVSWLDSALTADVFISIVAPNISSQAGLNPQIIDEVLNTSGVGRVATVRRVLYNSPEYGLFNLVAVTEDLATENREFVWRELDNDQLWNQMQKNSILISESFAYRNNIEPGAGTAIELQTDEGIKEFEVTGIYYDYGAQSGVLLISDDLYRSLWQDDKITSLGVYVSQINNVEKTVGELRTSLSGYSNLVIRSNNNLKESAIKTFDRTFTVTSALRILIAIVAFISVLSSLMALQLEREREFGVYRAIGMTISQLRKMLFLENGLIGLASGIFSIPLGLALSLILIYVINLRSFGWTLNFSIEPRYFIEALGIALVASIAAGLYPAYLIGKEDVGKLIREE
ncbi:MAG: permease [Thermodesulfobacteriota bacterium]|nr:MAG: permease [Thermodesulfobacteriota bacterium]